MGDELYFITEQANKQAGHLLESAAHDRLHLGTQNPVATLWERIMSYSCWAYRSRNTRRTEITDDIRKSNWVILFNTHNRPLKTAFYRVRCYSWTIVRIGSPRPRHGEDVLSLHSYRRAHWKITATHWILNNSVNSHNIRVFKLHILWKASFLFDTNQTSL